MKKWLLAAVLVLVASAAAVLWFLPDLRRLRDPYYQTPAEFLQRSKDAIVGRLKDPESARFGEVRVYSTFEGAGMMACGTFNAKNALGGYVGFKRFATTDSAISQPEIDDDNPRFEDTWQRCTGKPLAATKADLKQSDK